MLWGCASLSSCWEIKTVITCKFCLSKRIDFLKLVSRVGITSGELQLGQGKQMGQWLKPVYPEQLEFSSLLSGLGAFGCESCLLHGLTE